MPLAFMNFRYSFLAIAHGVLPTTGSQIAADARNLKYLRRSSLSGKLRACLTMHQAR
jgi:hypothetical protein